MRATAWLRAAAVAASAARGRGGPRKVVQLVQFQMHYISLMMTMQMILKQAMLLKT